MRISSLWAALALACIIIVAAAGASFAHADFTSMFTFALPEHSHAQASPLKSGDFVWRALDIASRTIGANDSGVNDVLAIKSRMDSGSISAPEVTSDTDWADKLLKPSIEQGKSLAMASYDNYLQRYMNGTGNIFTS